tara:strand:- start:5967 stop:11276 length:5310 start_codon:yes stop_codon:yes gene_type:complete
MPDDSFVRIENEDDRKRLLPVLIEVYQFESDEKLSGSSGGVKRFSDCLWTTEEMLAHIAPKLSSLTPNEVEARLQELIDMMTAPDARHMLKIPPNGENPHRYITRVAEINRTVLCLHEYTNRETSTQAGGTENKKFPIIDGLRWEPRLRYGSERKHDSAKLIQSVRDSFGQNHRLPASFGNLNLDAALEDLDLVLKATSHVFTGNNNDLKFTEFQLNAIVQAFKNSWSNGTNSVLVITAGTGMGKTLGFTIPVITDALLANRTVPDGEKACSQLLMYPRNDLAKDQFESITKIVKRLNYNFIRNNEESKCIGTLLDADGRVKHSQPRFPTSAGQAPNWGVGGTNVYDASLEAYAGVNINGKPASIIACSIESFRRRLRIPAVCNRLATDLRRIVFDEVHLSSGIQGGHHSRLLSRCRQLVARSGARQNNSLSFIGVSATIAKPRLHLSKLWYANDTSAIYVDHVDSEELQRDAPMGIRHNVLVRPRKGPSPIGTLVDMTSAVTHQRRSRDFYDRPQTGAGYNYEELQKTVGFADSHEIVGNWYSFMLDNESTSWANRLENDARRPYAHWHSKPLEIHPGGEEVCGSCQTMQYHAQPITVVEGDLPKFRYRPADTLQTASSWELPLYGSGTGNLQVKGLDTCHHLESGTCWWFSPRTMNPEPRPGSLGTSYRDVIRVKRHTGKTRQGGEDLAEGEARADYSFRSIPKKGGYPRGYDDIQHPPIPHDVAIATPTLEVGVDMSNVSEVLTHKAIRNISSYRQKVGRAGREAGTDALAMTLMSPRRQEFQYYRSMIRLIDSNILEPVPVASNNLAMMAHQAYEGVFDYLSMNNHSIEYIPSLVKQNQGDPRYQEWAALSANILSAIQDICTFNQQTKTPTAVDRNCDDYLREAVKIYDADIRRRAIFTVAEHLSLFLEEMPIGQGVTVIQYLASKNANQPLNAPRFNVKEWNFIEGILDAETQQPQVHDSLNQADQKDFLDIFQYLKTAFNNLSVTDLQSALSLLSNFIQTKGYNQTTDVFIFYFGILNFQRTMNANAPSITRIAKEVRSLLSPRDTRTLSMVMYNCSVFLMDAPYCPLNTLFANPHEAPVKVKHGQKTEYITAKEAIQYTLPGMWTHRLFGGQRTFVTHRGDVEILNPDVDNRFKIHLDENEYAPILANINQNILATELSRIPNILDIRPSLNTRKWNLKQLKVKSDYGVEGEPNSIFQGLDPFMGLMYSNYQPKDISQGHAGKIKRPRAHSVTWQMSDVSESTNSISTYKIMNTEPAAVGEPETVPVVRHPLMNVLFSSIKFDENMVINRMAFGVTRSNQIILHNFVEEESAAIVDEFETNGIRFEMSQEKMAHARALGENPEHPFDERVLKMIGEWILSEKEKFGANSFKIESILDILTDEAFRQSNQQVQAGEFPGTVGEFFTLLFASGNLWSKEVISNRLHQDTISEEEIQEEIEEFNLIKNKLIAESQYLLANYASMMGNWYQRTFLNTLGLAISESVAEFSGVAGSRISYAFDIESDVEGPISAHIDVYDEDALGNGSCELAEKFFHIPIEIRELANHFGDRNLPSASFVEILEDRLRMCEEHMMHSIALSGTIPQGIPRWMNLEANQLIERFSINYWNTLGISSPIEASLHKRRRFAFVLQDDNYRQNMLSWELALDLCDVGCSACDGDEFGNLFPPHLVAYTTCRSVVDSVLGDWADMEGYLRKNEHSVTLMTESGNNATNPVTYVNIKGRGPRANGIYRRFIKYPCPPIGLSWLRNMQVPNVVDKYVRHQEVV